jgi:hypothetical protein
MMPEKDEKPKDPYTGEEKPPSEDAEDVVEVVPVDEGDHEGEDYLLEEETSMDAVTAEEAPDAVAHRSTRHTREEPIEEEFEDRQQLAVSGREELEEELEEHHAESPQLSGGDIDAAWEDANAAGEETVGGTTPTPDQDVVDELGEAVGVTYDEGEPLDTQKKINQRDRERWELDPDAREEERQPPEVRDKIEQEEEQQEEE